MATAAEVARPFTSVRQATPVFFHWALACLAVLDVSGAFLDAWAHHHDRADETFFTPWHLLLYSSVALTGAVLAARTVANHRGGTPWRESVPRGYGLSLIGVTGFLLAGAGDLVWHSFFGRELEIETLLSPAHQALAASGVLMAAGPLRALHGYRGPASWGTVGPAILATAASASLLVFMTQYAHPFVEPVAGGRGNEMTRAYGVGSILIQTSLLVGPVLFLLHQWRLPPGAITAIFALPSLLTVPLADHYDFLPGALLAGMLADILYQGVPPQSAGWRGYVWPFFAPVFVWIAYFTAIGAGRIAWSAHLWVGSVIAAGLLGVTLALARRSAASGPSSDSAPATA